MLRHLAMASLILIWPTFPASILDAEDWPRFRGPNGTGVSGSQGLPTQFGPETNVIWKIDSGGGSSSPVIAAGRLHFTSFDGDSRIVHCRDAQTGKDLWRSSFQKNRVENATRPNGPATCTAAADGTCVVFFLPDTGLYCYEASGTSRWDAEVGPFYSMHGIAGSPVIAGGKVLILADQLAGSHLAAYDLATGRLAWKVDRSDGLTGGYSTPSVMKSSNGSTLVVVSGPAELCAYDVATGEKAWSIAGVTNAPVSVPIVCGNRVFTCEPVGAVSPISMLARMDENKDGKYSMEEVKASVSMSRLLKKMDQQWGNGDGVVEASEWQKAFGGFVGKAGLVAVDLDESGGATKARVRWNYRKTVPYVSSPLVYENVLYFVQDGGILTTIDPDSGEVLKRGRLRQGGRQFYASLVAADGKVFALDTAGNLTVLRAGAQWEQLAMNSLGEPCYATPAVCNGRIYVRTQQTMYCFGKGD